MIDPPRLLSTSTDELELAVIRSARLDVPPAKSLRGVAAALSVGPAALAAAKPAAAATGAAAATPAVAAVQSLLTASSLFKPFFAGILGGVLTVGATAGVQHALRASEPAPVAVAQSAPGAPPAASPRPTAVPVNGAAPDELGRAMPVSPVEAPAPVAQRSPVRGTRAALPLPAALPAAATDAVEALATTTPSPPAAAFEPEPAPKAVPEKTALRTSPSIAAEIALVERARLALGQGNSRAALAFLDEYAATSPSSALAPEAKLLRIQALDAAGERGAAAALAREFVEHFPQSRHVPALVKFIDAR